MAARRFPSKVDRWLVILIGAMLVLELFVFTLGVSIILATLIIPFETIAIPLLLEVNSLKVIG